EQELALGDRAHWGNCRYYVCASRYAPQVAAYTRLFGTDNLCVLAFERLVAEPAHELQRLFGFLGIDLPGELSLPRENSTRAARFPGLHKGLRDSGLKAMLRGLWQRSAGTGLGRMARSMYYRDKQGVVPEEDLRRVRTLLQAHGMDSYLAEAA
ncbi:MAG TPA: sulfotransferase domain-containing protein, partial [Xanthomonadaceae bacterium]|nr:sulfotransferase domain-containing protein [Xanthomonadaceae bacterium]